MSLKRRLVAAMLLLFIAAIVVANLVTSSFLRSFLVGRLDEQIDVAQTQAYTYIYTVNQRDVLAHDALATSDPKAWLTQLTTSGDPSCISSSRVGLRPTSAGSTGTGATTPTSGGTASGGAASGADSTSVPRLNAVSLAARLNPDVYVEVLGTGGKVLFDDPSGSCASPDPAPLLSSHLPVQALPLSHVFGGKHGPYLPDRPSFEVQAKGASGTYYRVQAVAVPGGTLVTAISLHPTSQTLASLTHVEVGVSIAVVAVLLVLVLVIVRFGLRPLDDMTKTAGAIAGGDLTRRIQRMDDKSEVGRLGAALNGMLSQIEAAFRERAGSESRLRRFVADASHELRTPLTSIRGYAELLRKEALSDDESRRRAAERIEGEAARMSVLVDDLLLLARLDQGRPLDRSPVDVAEVVSDAVDAARTSDPGRTISLDAPSSVVVEGDPLRLRQIVDNLLRNAQVHTPAGTPVRVSVSSRGDFALVVVADEGPGLDAEEQARVFDRFYRGNVVRTGGGSGLGLSIVAALATAHGGRAYVESAPGEGATFTIELPVRPGAREEAGGSKSPGERGEPAGGAGAAGTTGVAERGEVAGADPSGQPEAHPVANSARR